MKGVIISMLYQYFDAKERQLQIDIDKYERKLGEYLSSEDLHELEKLRIKREIYNSIFHDLSEFVVDFL